MEIVTQIGQLFPAFDAALAAGILVFARMIGFIMLAPVFNRKEIPSIVKIGFAFILTVTLTTVMKPPAPPADNSLLLSIILNITVGVIIGYMARLILIAIDAGADMINMQMGLSSAMVLDPTSQTQISILEKYFSLFAILLFIHLGGIYWLLLATLGQDIILGVISKTAPQVNVFQLSFLFKPVFGAAILIWILPMLVNVISDYFLSFSHIL